MKATTAAADTVAMMGPCHPQKRAEVLNEAGLAFTDCPSRTSKRNKSIFGL